MFHVVLWNDSSCTKTRKWHWSCRLFFSLLISLLFCRNLAAIKWLWGHLSRIFQEEEALQEISNRERSVRKCERCQKVGNGEKRPSQSSRQFTSSQRFPMRWGTARWILFLRVMFGTTSECQFIYLRQWLCDYLENEIAIFIDFLPTDDATDDNERYLIYHDKIGHLRKLGIWNTKCQAMPMLKEGRSQNKHKTRIILLTT